MSASSAATFLSPRPSPKVHDCRQHPSPSTHALSSLASPTQSRGHTCNILSSPIKRHIAQTCSAIPFGFPSFGFPSFGSPSGSGPGGKGGSNNGGNNNVVNDEGEWIRASGAPPSKGCNSDTADGAGSGTAAAAAASGGPAAGGSQQASSASSQQSARRHFHMPPLPSATSAAASTAITTVATSNNADTVSSPRTSFAASTPTDWYPDGPEELEQQRAVGGGAASGLRGSPLPYPWTLSDNQEDCGSDDVAASWTGNGSAGVHSLSASLVRAELDMSSLRQLLLELSGREDEQSPVHHLSHQQDQDKETSGKHNSRSSSLLDSGSLQKASEAQRASRAGLLRRRRHRVQQQRALLDQLHSGLVGGKLKPDMLLQVPGLLPFLTEAVMAIDEAAAEPGQLGGVRGMYGDNLKKNGMDRYQVPERGVSAATSVALECLCTLLTEESLIDPDQHPGLEPQLVAAVEAAVGVLRAARLPSAVIAPSHNPSQPPATNKSSYPSTLLVPTGPAGPKPLGGATDGWSDGTAEEYGWSADISAAFFATSVLVQAARVPELAEAAVAAGGLGLLVRLMGCRPTMLVQMAVFATYKLVCQTLPPVQTAAEPHQQGGRSLAAAAAGMPGEAHHHQRERDWRDAALLVLVQSGGLGALCGCMEVLDDRPSRDMASALMLDMALVPQVPAVVAGLNHVQPLVGLLRSRRCDHIARMYALLVLARLCNHSAECQMDAVREGAVEPLLSLVQRGCDEEQTHACRLLAILAQAVPTHGRIKASGVVPAVLPLLQGSRGSGAVVAEHATSVLAVLAQNPDMHFHIVGCGAVPAMVPLLSSGTEKARTYVLATLMLLCEQEERHAAVVVRAGALPILVSMVATMSMAAPRRPAAAATEVVSTSSPSSAASPRAVASAQEFAAAVLCSLSRYVGMQAELLTSSALPALVRCLGQGPPEAAINAAEALVHLAAGNTEAKQEVGGDPTAARVLLRLLVHPKPAARYWALQLLRAISTDDEALRLVAGLPDEDDEDQDESPEKEGGSQAESKIQPRLGAQQMDSSAILSYTKELSGSYGLRLPPLKTLLAAEAEALRGGNGGERQNSARAVELVSALVRLLRWPEEAPVSWQQGRCRVLAGWLLARLCGLRRVAPLLLASGAVRELMAVLAEEKRRHADIVAAAATGFGAQCGKALPPPPGEGDGEGFPSSFEADEDEECGTTLGELYQRGAWPERWMLPVGSGGSGSGSGGNEGNIAHPRRMRFDMNASAAVTAALLSVARTGRDGQMAVLSELALLHWMGISVRLDGIERF
ncbi:hypothetical protein VaNZ11_012937 [Volvox africanus]|uniref:Uncharacterized protein n=1 Tax=Volvox africanus TaxID=51714 RepID=A0ABQ5SG43_9CHLO|nr:hypothetical protein VaNZ11_012937 [Volvox africanus]